MPQENTAGFKVEKDYGLCVDIKFQTLTYFKITNVSKQHRWSGKGDNKLLLPFPIKTMDDLINFMILLNDMFAEGRLLLKRIENTNSKLLMCGFT